MSDHPDQRRQRCKRLGHEVTFNYCCTQESDRVCPQVLNCWWQHFDVRTHLVEILGEDTVKKLETQPPPKAKVLSLLELIEQAKKRQAEQAVKDA